MPRRPRFLIDNGIYHVLNRQNEKHRIFCNEYHYSAYLEVVEEGLEKHDVRLLAYCIMPNHFHFTLQPLEAVEMSRFMHWVTTTHVRRFHRDNETSGHLWQGPYKHFPIQNDSHLLSILRYIERNPVTAQLVDEAEKWMWSSFPERRSGGCGSLGRRLISEPPMAMPSNYAELVNTPLTAKDLEAIRTCLSKQIPYGDTDWRESLKEGDYPPL